MGRASRPLLGGALLASRNLDLTALSARTRLRRGLPRQLKDSVLARDNYFCRWCGFRAEQFQEVVVLNDRGRDPDSMVTACIFCHQCFHLDYVAEMQSGALIWLPELDQLEVIHLAREAYVFQRGRTADTARRVLKHLTSRRAAARDRLGTAEVAEALPHLMRMAAEPDGEAAELIRGLRLLPLDRRVAREANLEFDQFPRILAFWRSPAGPFAGIRQHPGIDRYLAEIAGESTPVASVAPVAGDSPDAPTAGRSPPPQAPPTTRAVMFDVDLGDDFEWRPLEPALRPLLTTLGTIDGQLSPQGDATQCVSLELPWYRGIRLLRITDSSRPVEHRAAYYLLDREHRLLRLDGESGPIHQTNLEHGIRLDRDNALGYVRFFCYFVHGEEGPFYVPDARARGILAKFTDALEPAALRAALDPPTCEGSDENGQFRCRAGVWYSTSLFAATFLVRSDGMIEMVDDEIVASDLPLRPRATLRA